MSKDIKVYIKLLIMCIILFGILTALGYLRFGRIVTFMEWVKLSVALKTTHFFLFMLVIPCFGIALSLFGICRCFYLRRKEQKQC